MTIKGSVRQNKRVKRMLGWRCLTTLRKSLASWLRTSCHTRNLRRGSKRQLFPEASFLKCVKKSKPSSVWQVSWRRCIPPITSPRHNSFFQVRQLIRLTVLYSEHMNAAIWQSIRRSSPTHHVQRSLARSQITDWTRNRLIKTSADRLILEVMLKNENIVLTLISNGFIKFNLNR